MIALFCCAAVIGIALVVSTAASGGLFTGIGLFLLCWFLAMAWSGYWFLLKIAAELRFDGEVLVAITAVSERRIPIDDLLGIRPFELGPVFAVFELSDGSTVMALAGNGFSPFVDAISQRQPSLPVWSGPFGKVVDLPFVYSGVKQVDEPPTS